MTGSVPFTISLSKPLTAWTPAQWVAAWQSKVDTNNPTITGGLAQSVATSWSGPTFPGTNNLANYSAQTYAGTPAAGFSDTSGTVVPFNLWYISSDQLVWTGPVNGFEFKHQFGGGVTSGGRQTMLVDSNFQGPVANTSNNNFTGFQLFQTASGNVTGAASGSGNGLGNFFAMSLQYGRLASGTFAHEVNAFEIDYTPGAGSSTDYSYGVKLVNVAPASYHAYLFEAALNFVSSNPGTTGTWNKVIWFGDPQAPGGLGFPGSATGTLIGSFAGTTGTAIDFSALTATSLLKGPASFNIDGSAYVHSPGVIPATGNNTGFYNAGLVPIIVAVTVATPVNYFSVTNAATGNTPTLSTAGTDANVSTAFKNATGVGDWLFWDGSNVRQLEILGTASVVSWPSLKAAASGNNILFDVGALGTATGISIGATKATSLIIGNASATTQILGKIRIGTTGAPTMTSGSGAPGATEPNGSLWLRTDGSTNTRLYISTGGGVWVPAITSFADIDLSGLPTSDPGGGKPWLNGGILQVGP